MDFYTWCFTIKPISCASSARYVKGKTFKEIVLDGKTNPNSPARKGDGVCFILDKIYRLNTPAGQQKEVWEMEWWKVFLDHLFGDDCIFGYEERYYIWYGWHSYWQDKGNLGYFKDYEGGFWAVVDMLPESIEGVD